MPRGNSFAADLLERSAAGYGGYAAGLMLEREPDLRESQGPDAFGSWKTHLTQRVLELAAAVATGESRLFTSRVAWSNKAFVARGRDPRWLRLSLESLASVLGERLPGPARSMPLEFIQLAIAALSDPAQAEEPSSLDPRRQTDRIALRYLQQVLEGNVAEAIRELTEAAANGLGLQAAYVDVLLPAQREIGRLWHLGDVTIAEEHLVSFATQRAMAVLSSQAEAAPPNGRTCVVAAVSTNVHDIGLRALADLYQLAGWRTIFLGSDVPIDDMPAVLTFFEADLLLLGAMLSTQIPKVEQTVSLVHERCERPVKVIVGGSAFDDAPELWREIGCDAYAPTVQDAVAEGRRLAGL
ncbi:MAG: cobalamin-dependent protein [Chromatiales bacterium]|nr:cobalamin-dependent protein [Chromatiales bacterium]